MFMIHMPEDFKVGDTAACRINGEPQRVTWRDQNTLVIEPDDARQIFHTETDGELRCFMCGDAAAKNASVYPSPDWAQSSSAGVLKRLTVERDALVTLRGRVMKHINNPVPPTLAIALAI